LNINIYIDGFNLYFCGVKNTPFKRLNLSLFCSNLFPRYSLGNIKYFSARVTALPWDLDAPRRQDVYWRALRTIRGLEIIEGNFASHPRYLPRFPFVYGADNRPLKARVLRTEERGSDVNLAAYLIYDNFTDATNGVEGQSAVISNDSDLAEAIGLVTKGLKRSVIVVNPNRTRRVHKNPDCMMHGRLKAAATDTILSLNESLLAKSQFSPTVTDANGTFSKPEC
jgi:hypothetical protein